MRKLNSIKNETITNTLVCANANVCDTETDHDSDSSMDLSNPHITRGQIQSMLGFRPQNLKYYRRSLVHKSIQRNVKKVTQRANKKNTDTQDYMLESNETLEFLGDSVLNLIVTNYLFLHFSDKNEGSMTRLKTKIVCRRGCAAFARELGIGRYILTSDFINIDTYTDKILEDTFEAFVAAIFLDLGFKFAVVFVERLIEKYIDFDDICIDTNYKDILLRYSQNQGYDLPVYTEIQKDGPAHGRTFTMSVNISADSATTTSYIPAPGPVGPLPGPLPMPGPLTTLTPLTTQGSGKSKKIAEQEAAHNLLNLLPGSVLEKFTNRDL